MVVYKKMDRMLFCSTPLFDDKVTVKKNEFKTILISYKTKLLAKP